MMTDTSGAGAESRLPTGAPKDQRGPSEMNAPAPAVAGSAPNRAGDVVPPAEPAGAAAAVRHERLAVVTPLANEEDTINVFLDRVLAHLLPQDRIFCVVDKISSDNTRHIITDRGATDPRLVLVWAPENRCVVDAYFRGYREALTYGADWILEMDGGLSHLPEQIPDFVAAMQNGAEYAGGSRFSAGGRHRGGIMRYSISRGGSALANLLLGTQMRDMTSGYECFTHAALSEVVEKGVRSRAHFFQTEIRQMMHQRKWVEVPIEYSCPSKSVGKTSLKEAFVNLWQLYRETKGPVRMGVQEIAANQPNDSRGDNHSRTHGVPAPAGRNITAAQPATPGHRG